MQHQNANITKNTTAHAFNLGSCLTFDGIALFNTRDGNHYLIYNTMNGLYVQANYVPCHQHYVCINAVAVSYAHSVFVVRAPKMEAEQALVLVNRTTMTSLSTSLYGTAGEFVSFTRHSRLRFSFEIATKLELSIRLYSRFLDVSCSISNLSYCQNSSGLFGSCNNNSLDDLHDYKSSLSGQFRNSTEYNTTSSLSTVSQKFITDVCIKSWHVNASYDLMLRSGLNLSTKAFSLRVNNTILTTNEIYTISGFDVTVEIYVKVLEHGVLWTYSTNSIFGLIAKSTLIIFQDMTKIDTGLILNFHQWYKISLVFEAAAKSLKVYTVEMNGFFNLRTYTNMFRQDTFYPGGIITIGAPYISAAGAVNMKGFIGDIFELRIWNKTVTTNEIRTTVSKFIPCSSKDFATMWKFEQMQEPAIVDCVSNIRLQKVTSVLASKLTWPNIDLNNVYDVSDIAIAFVDVTKLRKLEKICQRVFSGPAFTSCKSRNNQSASLYNVMCIRELWTQAGALFPQFTATAYSEYCSHHYPNAEQLLKKGCQVFAHANREWSGPGCGTYCQFGSFDKDDKCICLNGFYGKSCSSECPGGFSSSCHGQGACHKANGGCECLRNFKDNRCEGCATNWTSSDCGIVSRSRGPHFEQYTCQSFKRSLIGFSATGLRIDSFGEYTMVKTHDTEIQARYIPCSNSSVCLHAVGLNIDSTNITVYNPNTTEKGRYVWHNKRPLLVENSQMVGSKFQIIPVSASKLKIRTFGGHAMNVSLTFFAPDMMVTIVSDSCALLNGLCGSCKAHQGQDYSKNKSSEIVKTWMRGNKVVDMASLFLYNKSPFYESRNLSDFGHMVYLHDSGLSSGELHNLFNPLSDFTIEIFAKIISPNGTLLSYSDNDTTGIVITDTFQIYKGEEVMDCKIKPKLNIWVRLVITYNAKISLLSFYQFTSQHNYEVNKVILKWPVFGSKGHFLLGYWQTTKSRPNAVQLAPFFGYFDELRIWRKTFDQFQLTYLHRPNIPFMEGLKACWEFNEGYGRVMTDHVSGIELRLAKSVDTLTIWRFSEQYQLNAKLTPKVVSVQNLTLKSEIDSQCTAMMYHEDLEERCGKYIGKAFVDYFFLSCVRNGYRSRTLHGTYPSVIAYIEYCKTSLTIKSWPRSKACDLIPEKYYTSIDATQCAIPCVFGTVDKEVVKCICSKGYWGIDCSKSCPGGSVNTCSGKGDCNTTTGVCDCQENWKGNPNCSACTPGWTGKECQLVITPEPPSSVCSFMPGGHLITLNSVHTTFYGHGEFYMLGNEANDVRIHLHQLPSVDDKTRYIESIALVSGEHTIALVASEVDNSEPSLFVNKRHVKMAGNTLNSLNVVINRKESSLYDVILGNNTRDMVHLNIRNLGLELAVTLKITGKYCNVSTSLCSTCFKENRKLFGLSHVEIESAVRVSAGNLILSSNVFATTKFRLRVQNVGVSTNVLPALFYRRDLTIEIKFKASGTSVYESTLFAISRRYSFGIIVQGTLKIVVSKSIYDTSYKIEKDVLNQVTVVYSNSLRRITLYYIDSKSTIWQDTVDLPPWFTFVDPFSTLVVGEWLSGTRERFFYPASGFQGVVQEMRIWKHAYSFVDVKRLLTKEIKKTNKDLLSLWKFNEGRGNVVRDLVSGVNLFIPPVPTGPQWIRITLNEQAITVGNDVHFPDYYKKQEAVGWCYVKIYSSPLYVACKPLGRPSLRYVKLLSVIVLQAVANLRRSVEKLGQLLSSIQ